jgi:hypothetical protein
VITGVVEAIISRYVELVTVFMSFSCPVMPYTSDNMYMLQYYSVIPTQNVSNQLGDRFYLVCLTLYAFLSLLSYASLGKIC